MIPEIVQRRDLGDGWEHQVIKLVPTEYDLSSSHRMGFLPPPKPRYLVVECYDTRRGIWTKRTRCRDLASALTLFESLPNEHPERPAPRPPHHEPADWPGRATRTAFGGWTGD